MAVESRFVVIRHGVEVETFMDKKSADEYDKMLDMADNMAEFLESAPVDLDENLREELSIFLARNREDVLIALQAKKAKPVAKRPAKTTEPAALVEQPSPDEQEVLVEAKVEEADDKAVAKSPKKRAPRKTKAKSDAA